MARPRKPARLWQRPDDGAWLILDRDLPGGQRRTGHGGASGRGPAEAALRDYLRTKTVRRGAAAIPEEITVGEVLALYLTDKGEIVAGAETLAYCVKALAPFWGHLPVSDVIGSNCRRYAAARAVPRDVEYVGKRGKRWTRTLVAGPAKVRRELGVLTQALKYAVAEGRLTSAPEVTLTEDSVPRDRWLDRSEVARLLRAAAPHVRRFILISVTTGTRASAVLALRWTPSTGSGYVDLETGVLHRRGRRERETNKRRGAVRLTRGLLAHLRRWRAGGGTHVVMWRGKQLEEIDTGFNRAVARAGLEDVTVHDLKRTAVTWFFQRGGTMEDAVEYFSTSQTTLLKYYRSHSPHYQSRAVEVMERRPGAKA